MARLWMYADLPIPAAEIGDLKHYKVLAMEDPIELLRAVHAFVGYEAYVPELVDRVWKVLEMFPAADDRTAKQ